MLTRREVILAKVETAYNWDSAPTASANAVLAEEPSWSFEGARMVERSSAAGTMANKQSVFGGTLQSISFNVELKGSGVMDTPPECGVLLRGCGMSETISVGTSVTYEPASSSHESLTIYYYADGLLNVLTGARGTFTCSLEAGNKGMLSFTFTGHVMQFGTAQSGSATTIVLPSDASATDDLYNGMVIEITHGTGAGQSKTITDYTGSTKTATVSTWTTNPDSTSRFKIHNGPIDRAIVSPTFDSTVPPIINAIPFSIASYEATINALEFDMGLTVATPTSVSSPDGFSDIYLTERNVSGSFDPEAVLVATHDFIGNWRNGTSMALTTNTIGDAAGNQIKFTLPAVFYTEAAQGDRDGLRTYQMSFGAAESSGDDEITILFT
jgi:hypothetical protein